VDDNLWSEPPERPITTPPEYQARTAEARRRLADLLQPKTEQEHAVVRWLADQLDLQHLLVLVELVEYRRDR
jgi:hypothetical protein